MGFHDSERSHQKLCHVSSSVSRRFQRFEKALISNFVENLAVAKGTRTVTRSYQRTIKDISENLQFAKVREGYAKGNAKATPKHRSREGYAKGNAKQIHMISIVFLSRSWQASGLSDFS